MSSFKNNNHILHKPLLIYIVLIFCILFIPSCSAGRPSEDDVLSDLGVLTDNSKDDCWTAVSSAVNKGDEGAAAIINILKDSNAKLEAIDDLLVIAPYDGTSADRHKNAQDILIKIYDGQAGQRMKEAFIEKVGRFLFDKYIYIPSEPDFLDSMLSAYINKTTEDKLDDINLFVNKKMIGYKYILLKCYELEADTEIKKVIAKSFAEDVVAFVEYFADIQEKTNRIKGSLFDQIIYDMGDLSVSAEMRVIGRLNTTPGLKDYRPMFKKALDIIEPTISKTEIVEELFSEENGAAVASYLEDTCDPDCLDALLTLFNQTDDAEKLEKLCGILKNYSDDSIAECYVNKLNNNQEKYEMIKNSWPLSAALYLYNKSDIGFDAILSICDKYEMIGPFAENLVQRLSKADLDGKTMNFLSDAFVNGANHDALYGFYLGEMDGIPINAYLDGYNKQPVSGLDKNKTVIIEVNDKFEGSSSTYRFSPYTFLLVPEEHRVSFDDLYSAGTVIYIHYVFVNPTAYTFQLPPGTEANGESKTVYGYEMHCIITKMNIITGKVISKYEWSGTPLDTDKVFVNEDAHDFYMGNDSIKENIDRFRSIIEGK